MPVQKVGTCRAGRWPRLDAPQNQNRPLEFEGGIVTEDLNVLA